MIRRVAKFEIEVLLDDVPGWGFTEHDWIEHLNRNCIPSHYAHSVKHISTTQKEVSFVRSSDVVEQMLDDQEKALQKLFSIQEK